MTLITSSSFAPVQKPLTPASVLFPDLLTGCDMPENGGITGTQGKTDFRPEIIKRILPAQGCDLPENGGIGGYSQASEAKVPYVCYYA